MITTQAYPTIRAIQRDAWNDCFPGALEDWDYYVAVENAAIAGWQGLFKPDMAPEAGRRSGGRQPANTYKHAGAAAAIFDGVWE